MSESEQFSIGAEVRATDGEVCGEIRYLAVDPAARTLTDVAVEEKGRQGLGRLVPLASLRSDPGSGAVRFLGSMADYEKLEPADVTRFAPGTVGYDLYGTEQVVEEPEYSPRSGEQVMGSEVLGVSYTETADIVPTGDVEIGRGDQVESGGQKFGHVRGLVVDRGDGQVTHVLVRVGHMGRHKEVAVPAGEVAEPFGSGGIRLRISRQDAEDLPPWHGGPPEG